LTQTHFTFSWVRDAHSLFRIQPKHQIGFKKWQN